MKNMKLIAMSALLALSSLSLTACSDADIAFGTGVVVGVIIGDDHDHHHHHRPRPPRYRGRWAAVDLSKLSASERVAVKYNLSAEQSQILTSHLLRAQAGDMSALAEIGFAKQDLVAIFNGENPSASTLTQLSTSLNLDLEQAHQLIQNIKADAIAAQDSLM